MPNATLSYTISDAVFQKKHASYLPQSGQVPENGSRAIGLQFCKLLVYRSSVPFITQTGKY